MDKDIHPVTEPVRARFDEVTLETGQPLTRSERPAIPDADTVWLTPLPEMIRMLAHAGLRIRWHQECSDAHLVMADSLLSAFSAADSAIAVQIGRRAVDELVATHGLWSTWLSTGRVRKFAMVTEKIAAR